ncbi:spore coat protein [Clostridium sp. 'White wine YQ']|uniref:spore coat protein n=1 Tax=Clostridium sp. 'White wine YQ' TaxID=3027474 RepID=UPI002365A800|nr:spore coat protein [Clostridium sp. 'White wine YQ']MDD7795478.1 spore coat protein [Clostridium sp. 'White wine YQ']
MATLTQKETMLLKDEKSHEDLCIKKYTKYSNEAEDPKLKQLFSSILQHENQHLNTINSILNGQVPNVNQQGQQGQQSQQNQQQNVKSTTGFSQKDCDLCQDALTTEKYVSSTYNTSIFEFKDHNIRQTLNHIQKEEQEHGEQIFNYMSEKGYYTTQ